MKIIGIESMTGQELGHELDRGGKFVVFEYTISVLIMTFKRSSDIYFVKGGQSAVGKGLAFSGLTLLLGWWGIPWGPIYSIGSLITNFGGGKNITHEVINALHQSSAG